ncbi:MAG: hypothetical protein AAF653_11165 [Chloroflexota bacterium]
MADNDSPENLNPLWYTCLMWWDINGFRWFFPNRMTDRRKALDPIALEVMSDTLRIPNEACRHGALHGLGHMHEQYPERVTDIIDRFLAVHTDISTELRGYAVAARAGNVL